MIISCVYQNSKWNTMTTVQTDQVRFTFSLRGSYVL